MSAVEVLRVPLEADLSGFVRMLLRLQIPHRVSEESGEQVLWVPENIGDDVRSLYQRYPQGSPDSELDAVAPALSTAPRRPSLAVQLRQSPVTALFLLLTVIVGAVTLLGDNLEAVRWLTFSDFQVRGDYTLNRSVVSSLEDGQWWRLFTPMLLHFGFLHIAMNGLWYWELGKRIERLQGWVNLIGLTLLFSFVSNVAQYVWTGPSLFGGLSGVVYGLLGHCWIYQLLSPNPTYYLPRSVLVMMLLWLVICMTGVFALIGFGEIANAAHVGGLLIGCLTGLLGGAFSRRKLAA